MHASMCRVVCVSMFRLYIPCNHVRVYMCRVKVYIYRVTVSACQGVITLQASEHVLRPNRVEACINPCTM